MPFGLPLDGVDPREALLQDKLVESDGPSWCTDWGFGVNKELLCLLRSMQ